LFTTLLTEEGLDNKLSTKKKKKKKKKTENIKLQEKFKRQKWKHKTVASTNGPCAAEFASLAYKCDQSTSYAGNAAKLRNTMCTCVCLPLAIQIYSNFVI